MHNKPELTKTKTIETRVIKFWSSGLMATTAYERIASHTKNKNQAYAKAMINEWVL